MKKNMSPRGSILIWTVLLGISLMTVFFYFSQRLALNSNVQKKSLEYQNTNQFLTSYADYLESLPVNLRQSGQIDYEGITGFMTNAADQIMGVLDANQTLQYKVQYGKAKVEWNRCAQSETGRYLDVNPHEGLVMGNCPNLEFDAVAEAPEGIITLKSGEAPLGYRITPIGNAILYDNQWTLDLQAKTPSKKVLNIHRVFD